MMPADTIDTKGVKRRVAELDARDTGRAIARLDPDDLKVLGLKPGELVKITGKRETVCRVMPTRGASRGKQAVHVDGVTRENAQARVDEEVGIEPVTLPLAQRVVIQSSGPSPSRNELDYIGNLLDELPVTKGDLLRVTPFGSRALHFVVSSVEPKGAGLIGADTVLELAKGKVKSGGASRNASEASPVTYEDVGGLRKQVSRIRETIELPLRFPQVFERLGIDPPKGVLLHGPPGCGKTLIARAIANESQANFFVISGPEIVHKNYGESEANLRKVWQEAVSKGPSIIFIDEIDSIAPKRETTQGEVEKRIVAQLLTLMDGLEAKSNVVVIAATNLPNNIDPALRRPGRFDREIEIPVPDRDGRREILDVYSSGMPIAEDVDLDRIADITHGCVGADIEALCREAALHCLRQIMGDINFATGELPYDKLADLTVDMNDFTSALAEITPSAMREVFVETPKVSWDDVGGLTDVKQRLIEAVDWPVRYESHYKVARVRPARGILLAGPPGVGKTLIAKATAKELGANFISVKGPELMSRYVGDSERAIREIFRKARQASPCVIFMDEVDSLLPNRTGQSSDGGVRERVAAQFLTEIDGVEELKGVLVLAATNRLDILDPAATRPGRFDHVIELDLPTHEDRTRIFEIHLQGRPLEATITATGLSEQAGPVSGAEIAAVCDHAAVIAIRQAIEHNESKPFITQEHFRRSFNEVLGVE